MSNSVDSSILKIGRSNDAHQRAASLQAGMWFKIKVRAIFDDLGDLEKAAHSALADRRVANTEWFRVSFEEAVGVIGALGR